MKSLPRLVVWTAIAGFVCETLLAADEAHIVALNGKHAVFAISPETGDIAALDEQKNSLVLYRAGFFSGKDDDSSSAPHTTSVEVGNAPSSVAYKKFNARGVWAVVCKKDANMYLFDAGTLEPVKKVPLIIAT